jgi:hypothetical protein
MGIGVNTACVLISEAPRLRTRRARLSRWLAPRVPQDELAVFPDEKAAGSNPAIPTEKFQVDGMIAKRSGHAIDRLLAIRWRDRISMLYARHAIGRIGRECHCGRTFGPHGLNGFPLSLLWQVRR